MNGKLFLNYITHDDSLSAQEEQVNERLGHAFGGSATRDACISISENEIT